MRTAVRFGVPDGAITSTAVGKRARRLATVKCRAFEKADFSLPPEEGGFLLAPRSQVELRILAPSPSHCRMCSTKIRRKKAMLKRSPTRAVSANTRWRNSESGSIGWRARLAPYEQESDHGRCHEAHDDERMAPALITLSCLWEFDRGSSLARLIGVQAT